MEVDSVSPPVPEEIFERIKATDPSALRSAARAFARAAEQVTGVQGRLSGLATATLSVWRGDGGLAWLNHIHQAVSLMGSGRYAFGCMAELLGEVARAAEDAREGVRHVERAVEAAGGDVTLASRAHADAVRVAERYHEAEQRLRRQLWALGDSAPVGAPPKPLAPLEPELPWWQRLLTGTVPPPYWDVGPDGRLYGVDEDGNLVPAHHGGPIPWELTQANWGGLFRVIPALARSGVRAGARGGPALARARRVMKVHIVDSMGWNIKHVAPKIKQWYNLPDDYASDEIPKWMWDGYLETVAHAAVKSGGVLRGRLRGEKGLQVTHAVLHFDYPTKRWLVVEFYASGPFAGQFATSFRPNPAQLDALLRAGTTVRAG